MISTYRLFPHLINITDVADTVKDTKSEAKGEIKAESKNETVIQVMNGSDAEADEALKAAGSGPHTKGAVRFCKAEMHSEYLSGTFYMPPMEYGKKAVAFHYYIFENRIVFIEEGEYVKNVLDRMSENIIRKNSGAGVFLADFIDTLTGDDLLTLIRIENRLAEMEDEAVIGSTDEFSHMLLKEKRRILTISHYYLQLSDMVNVFLQNDRGLFKANELAALRLSYERVKRLHEEATMLREYSTQISEVYQAQIDIQQNKTMKLLTIVATIFMPLTLLVGWYGMNFNMPELKWRYGYAAVILVSLLLLVLSIWYCRKKKFF